MKTILRVILFTLLAVLVFTTCDSPMGMGKEIDFEPPVLTLNPKPPTPLYVREGTRLTGTVTDNDVVDRVILMDSTTREQLFKATLLPNNRWEIDLVFSAEQNGETILADIVAFDRAGNSGAESIASVVLIIDITPPIVNDIWIQRTPTRTADLLPYMDFLDLAERDKRAELSANINKYQNGAFNIKAKLAENETRIEIVWLKIYDSEYPDTELLSLQPETGSSLYNPQWYVTEDMILDAGNRLLPVMNYKSNYYISDNNGVTPRYYYRIRIVAKDKSENESGIREEDGLMIVEDLGYMCLWNQSDFPKGILDPVAVGAGTDIVTTKGSSLPIEFFDDDKIEWAYAVFLTKEQWLGVNDKNEIVYIAPGVSLSGADEEKFELLQERLRGGQDVYNWRYDRYPGEDQSGNKILNLFSTPADEKTHYIITGNQSSDFGEFVLITLLKDQKQSPHDTSEYPNIVIYRKYNITLVDENAPLIVFDKKGNPPVLPGSPEENTFPTLTTDGKFTIHGYTLREDKGQQGLNLVKKFRLAWIPFGIKNQYGGPEENIPVVKKALEEGTGFPADVQWWDLSDDVEASEDYEVISGSDFRKQLFSKTFSILGDPDEDKPEYNNFFLNGKLENATKLFVFYAEDNMGHIVYTQFYLLGNKTPPSIDIWDITDKLIMTYIKDDPDSPPSVYEYSDKGEIKQEYIDKRDEFNELKHPDLKGVSSSLLDDDKTNSYRVYPRGTIVKFWAKAQATGNLSIKKILMEDITFEKVRTPLGYYDKDSSFSYVEYFPEVSQRVFLFTVTDSLDNEAKIQRTIAIASASTLTSITTAKQNGTYPAGEEIDIRANFDGLIYLKDRTAGKRPKLNVLYQRNGSPEVQQIECDDVSGSTLFLNFKFKVPLDAGGQLLTIYQGLTNPLSFDRPISLSTMDNIMDARDDGGAAYTPGNVTGFFWNSDKNSLQDPTNGKTIMLDGVAPIIDDIISIVDTKGPYSTSPNVYYFKDGESLSIKLKASKSIKISGDTTLRYRIERNSPTGVGGGGNTAYNTTAFEYRKINNSNEIIFTLDVNRTNIPADGKLVDISLYNNGGNAPGEANDNTTGTIIRSYITDDPGNPLTVSSFNTRLTTFNSNNTIYFDLTPPVKPETTLTGNTATQTPASTIVGSNPTQTINYSSSPYMAITNASLANEPYGTQRREYSLDGGLSWEIFPNAKSGWTTVRDYNTLNILNGQWSLKTRFIDRAGNEGETTDQLIYVKSDFPNLIAVNVQEPNATYKAGSKLNFTLDFDDVVTVPSTGVTLTVQDMSSTAQTPGGMSPSYSNIITASQTTGDSTVTFTWSLTANTYDMLNGLKITALDISGLKDKFGNLGPSTGITIGAPDAAGKATITITGNSASYNFSEIIVSTITPTVRSREPQNAQNKTGDITLFTADPETPPAPNTAIASGSISVDNKTIKLNFNKPMEKGNGTITIRPHAGYAIPAVFDNDEFNTVFNNCTTTDKNSLVGSTSMSAPALDQQTGLSAGPYLKITHGLKQGAGFTGNYSNSGNYYAGTTNDPATNPGTDAPGARGTDRMVPDLSLKWVLRYNITNIFDTTANSDVSKIRTALDNAKWRWQEIPVSNNIVAASGNSIIITLQQPLPDGLQWDLFYTEGTFADKAGNKAAGINRGDYWFWTKGAQKPVVRVNRKSYDARPAGNYAGDIVGKAGYSDTNAYSGNIASFNTVNYIITSETPQARIFSGTITGADGTGSITGAWSGNTNISTSSRTWNGTVTNNNGGRKPAASTQVLGDWVRPNLIFRHGNDGQNTTGTNTFNGNYNYLKEPGISIARKLGGSTSNNFIDTNRYYGFRSYNKDATITEINGVSIGDVNNQAYSTSVTGNFQYSSLQASKNYVVAMARIDHRTTAANGDKTYSNTNSATAKFSSDRGYEGVFRTVIAMNQSAITGSNGSNPMTEASHPMLLAGTDARSGLPTVPGFPLKDGVHRNDSRFVKVFYRGTNNETATGMIQTPTNAFYWVTTEMVTQWYLQLVGDGSGGGSYSKQGDVEDWVSAGYGDLSYALNLATW